MKMCFSLRIVNLLITLKTLDLSLFIITASRPFVMNNGMQLQIENCIFSYNSCTSIDTGCAAIRIDAIANVLINGCKFYNNKGLHHDRSDLGN